MAGAQHSCFRHMLVPSSSLLSAGRLPNMTRQQHVLIADKAIARGVQDPTFEALSTIALPAGNLVVSQQMQTPTVNGVILLPAGTTTISTGGLTVSSGGLTVPSGGGGTSVQAFAAAGAATFATTSTFSGAVNISSGGLTVSAGGISVPSGGSTTSVQALSAAGAATFASSVSAAGAATFASTAAVTGTFTAQGSTVLGMSSSNTLTVNAETTLQAAATVAGLLTSTGGITATGESQVGIGACSLLLQEFYPSAQVHVIRGILRGVFCAGSNTFGSGSGTTTPFTVYSAATFGTSGTTNTLTIYSPTTQAGSLTATGTVYFSGSLTAAGELVTHVRSLTGGQPCGLAAQPTLKLICLPCCIPSSLL